MSHGEGAGNTAPEAQAGFCEAPLRSRQPSDVGLGLRERLSRPTSRPFRRVRDASGFSDGRLDAGGTRLRHVL